MKGKVLIVLYREGKSRICIFLVFLQAKKNMNFWGREWLSVARHATGASHAPSKNYSFQARNTISRLYKPDFRLGLLLSQTFRLSALKKKKI